MDFDPYRAPQSSLEHPGAAKIGKPGIALGLGILGLPVTIGGLVLGTKAKSGPKKGLATAAVILCGIGLTLSALNLAWGAYLGATGQHPLVNQMRGDPQPR